MMNKQRAIEKIKKLVERYGKLSEDERRKYNERQTSDHFIRPLFEALGWNFEENVYSEVDVYGKRADFAFKIGGITKFFVEIKAIPINLDEERWAEQAINYSWHKSVPWVILTDFEAIKVFNTEWDIPDIQSCQFVEILYTDYLTSEKLWWLSFEAFKNNILDKEADKLNRRPKKIIDEQLASDLIRWRDLLNDNLRSYNSNIEQRKISEYTQKILNRLIFIRTLEDRKIEDAILQPLVREWEEKEGIKANQLLSELNKIFRKIDKTYNSGLFAEGACDYLGKKIDADDNAFVEIINELYKTKNKGIRYNFADIPADIFGSIYEQYLGYIQKKDASENKTSKRKSQGIYYTPRYIVDYIVQNTLGEALKSKTPEEVRDLKILDPACGSGSFLLAAYQSLIDYWQRQEEKRFKQKSDKLRKIERMYKERNGSLISSQEKMRILLNNIYGVDLDKEAVELARLNLLLKMVGGKIKLPKLENNIQEGNSLISGSEKELKKYFGKNWKNKKPFNWKEKFSFCHSQSSFCHSLEKGNPESGFDVIIGNPPYVRPHKLDKDFKKYAWEYYKVFKAKSDIYAIFIQKAIGLLKDKGIVSFIVSNTWLSLESFSSLRKYILDECCVLSLVILPSKVFKDATVETVIFTFKKDKNKTNRNNNEVLIYEYDGKNFLEVNRIKQSHFLSTHFSIFDISCNNSLLNKIKKTSEPLQKYVNFYYGLKTGDDNKFITKKPVTGEHKKLLRRSDFKRYSVCYNNNYVWYVPKIMRENKITARPGDKKRFEHPKILIQDINKKLIATFDKDNYYIKDALMLHQKEKISLKYILALINSKLLNYWYRQQFKTLSIAKNAFLTLPIYKIDFSNPKEKAKHDKLAEMADEMLKLNKKLQKLDPMLDEAEYKEIKEKIERTDREIDGRVFELYGLGEKEIGIIKNSSKN